MSPHTDGLISMVHSVICESNDSNVNRGDEDKKQTSNSANKEKRTRDERWKMSARCSTCYTSSDMNKTIHVCASNPLVP